MARNNRVFVSPGVYTSETDLTFVSQSVGITTLGMAGETLKGPAFEPILIGSYDEFRTYFGGTSPEKYGNGNPKYELPYFAKSYLSQSNQLFVTRVLGLTGYKPKYSWTIKTLPGVVLTATGGTITTTTLTLASGTTYTYSGSVSSEFDKEVSTDVSIKEYILSFANTYKGTLNTVAIKMGDTSSTPSTASGKTTTSVFTTKAQWINTLYTGSTPTVLSYVVDFVEASSGATVNIQRESYTGSFNTEYDGVAVAMIRSRGTYNTNNNILNLAISATTGLTLSDTTAMLTNPFADFTLTAEESDKSFTCSFDSSSKTYISKVLGTSVTDKSSTDFPVYVNEVYSNFLVDAWANGYVRGLSATLTSEDEGTNYVAEWSTAQTPWIVSEVRGGKVSNLFRFLTVSDGASANTDLKISIINVNLQALEFDVIVRSYTDTDDSPVVVERFSRCSMDPKLPGYIGKKIGSNDGEYVLKSKNIMVEIADDAPTDAVPAGFGGYPYKTVGSTKAGSVAYKTKYNKANDTVVSSPSGVITVAKEDKIRKTYLGFSTSVKSDSSALEYKGEDIAGNTKGFHLSSQASAIEDDDSNILYTTTSMNFEASEDDFESINACKFTVYFYGGFDGWDIYRTNRTNTDAYVFGKTTYISGDSDSSGVFSITEGNSDYYAYLKGIKTFDNPEATNINLFATPGINFYDHAALVQEAIDMIEIDRADSLYIINSPNVDTTEEVIDHLDTIGLDSNYSATYFPWIQVKDTDNSTQAYIPVTGEVLKNIALTDNVSHPWFAPAGYKRGRVSAIKAKLKLTLDERDDLYKNRINPIATFSDVGPIVWGNKTLQVAESALDRLNVRRLFIQARKLISAVSIKLIFEQDDAAVAADFEKQVNPILQTIKNERGLIDFRVKVIQGPEEMDSNSLKGKLYLKPTKSLEFISVDFVITPTGASFENI